MKIDLTSYRISILIAVATLLAAVVIPLSRSSNELVLTTETTNTSRGRLQPWQSKAFTVTNANNIHWNTFVATSMGTIIRRKVYGDTSNEVSKLVLRNTLLNEREDDLRLATFREVYSLLKQHSVEVRSLCPPDVVRERGVVFMVTTLGSQSQTKDDPVHPCWMVSVGGVSEPFFPNGREGYYKGIYGGKFHLPTLYAYARR